MKLSCTPYEKLEIGQEASLKRLCTTDDFLVFAHASGNLNPMHLPDQDGDGDGLADLYVDGAPIPVITGCTGFVRKATPRSAAATPR